jgi:Na+-driven multidrug efflux pump
MQTAKERLQVSKTTDERHREPNAPAISVCRAAIPVASAIAPVSAVATAANVGVMTTMTGHDMPAASTGAGVTTPVCRHRGGRDHERAAATASSSENLCTIEILRKRFG